MSSNPRRLRLGDSSSRLLRPDVAKGPPQAAEEGSPAADATATAEGGVEPGVNLSESMENGRGTAAVAAAAVTPAATTSVFDDPDAGECGHGDGEDLFEVNEDNATGFKYDYKEAICLDLSRAGGVAQSTPGGDVATDPSRKGGAHPGANQAVVNRTGTGTNVVASTGGEQPATNQNPMDMSVSGKNDMRRFTDAVAATTAAADGDGDGASRAAPSAVGLSRRKAPMTPAVRYIMEAMCTDLQCCGECFVPHFRASQTLVRFCGFAPFAVDEGLDEETRRFMEGKSAYDTAKSGGADAGEAYGRGIGLPGIAWASSMASLVEISTLTSDGSFDSGGVRCEKRGVISTAVPVVEIVVYAAAPGPRQSPRYAGVYKKRHDDHG